MTPATATAWTEAQEKECQGFWWLLPLNSTVQYSTVQCSTVQCSTLQYIKVQYNTIDYSTVLSTVQPLTTARTDPAAKLVFPDERGYAMQ